MEVEKNERGIRRTQFNRNCCSYSGFVVHFFFSFIWPSIQNNFAKNTRCDEAICPCPERDNNGNCVVPEGGQVTCTYRDDNGTEHDITCAWKG